MEHNSEIVRMDDQMELPPGFRFHPTDEELITHYLSKKDLDVNFSAIAIGDVDMNKVEPWELPWKAKLGEKEWYFFCVRDKKYPTGLRTNRATAAGYWKATGKDKEIFRGKTLVGMKKTLVFYKGRAPKGLKSNWVTHEYRMEGNNLPKTAKNEWVISRVFHKTSGGKEVHISGLMRMDPIENELAPSTLLPLMDPPPYTTRIKPDETESRHVHCFSNSVVPHKKILENTITSINNPVFASSSNPMGSPWGQFPAIQNGLGSRFPGLNPTHDPSILGALLGNHGFGKEQEMISVSQETAASTDQESAMSNLEMGKRLFEGQDAPPSIGPNDLACM